MSYQQENLSALAYASGFTLWHYRTANSIEEVAETGYFDNAARMMRRGDFICINAGAGGDAPASTMLVVTKNDGRCVDVGNFAWGVPA